jgi:hypothetical protein
MPFSRHGILQQTNLLIRISRKLVDANHRWDSKLRDILEMAAEIIESGLDGFGVVLLEFLKFHTAVKLESANRGHEDDDVWEGFFYRHIEIIINWRWI